MKRVNLLHILLIVAVSLPAYINTLHASFHFDDLVSIVNNPAIKELKVFIEPSEAKNLLNNLPYGGLYTGFKSRYIGYLSLALNYKIHGLDVAGYHIVNLLIHIINGLLVYFLVTLTFKTPYLYKVTKSPSIPPLSSVEDRKGGQGGIFIALFSALLFVSHPIQTQAVTYIVQRFASLATMFYLLSLVMYVKFRIQDSGFRIQDKKPKKLASYLLYLASIFSAVLAMKTKEIAFTLPIIIVLYEFFFLPNSPVVVNQPPTTTPRSPNCIPHSTFRNPHFKRFLYLLPLLLTMLIIPLTLTGEDKPLTALLSDVSETTRLQTEMSRMDYLFTQFRVIVTYIRLLFWPINQNLDYDYPVYHSFLNPNVYLSFLFLLSIFSLGIYLFFRSRQIVHSSRLIAHSSKHSDYQLSAISYRLISFGIFWFFITLSVESSIIPIEDVILEHRVYLPSIGVVIAISSALFIVIEKLKKKWKNIDRMFIGVLALIIIVLTGATYARNMVWKDELSLWEDVVSKSPEKARAHHNLGLAYESQGAMDKAIEQYQITVRLQPDPRTYYNLGVAYHAKGLIDKAIEQYQIAIKLKSDFPEPHNNLGVAYKSKGLIDKAIEHYQIAIKLTPDPTTYYNLGIAYHAKGLIDEAIEHYRIAIKLKPDYVLPHLNLGRIYLERRDIGEARKEFEMVLQINPQYNEARKLLNSIVQREQK